MEHKKRFANSVSTVVVDNATGETLYDTTQVRTYEAGAEPGYVKLYLEDLSNLLSVSGTALKLANLMAQEMKFDDQLVVTNGYLKNKWATELDVKPGTITKIIREELVAKKILFKKAGGTFLVNPTYFGKGGWKNIKRIRLELVYEDNQRAMKIKLDDKDNNAEIEENELISG